MKHSNVFYIIKQDKTYEQVDGKRFKNNFGLDLFKHYDKKYGWRITEAKTGIKIYDGIPENFDNFIEKQGGIEKVKSAIDNAIQIHGYTPRYTEPEKRKEKKQVDPNRFFTKCLYEKTKKHFVRFYNENGVELLKMQSEINESYFQTYALCNSWAIPVGYSNNIVNIIEKLSNKDFSIHDWLVGSFEKQLSDADVWADLGVAEYLNRVDEAKKHNEPIRSKRDAENKKEQEKREIEERAFLIEKQTKYEATLLEAENKIKNLQFIRNAEVKIYKSRYNINETTVFNALFKKYGINIPLKTQGWINKALVEVYYDKEQQNYNYRYYKKSAESTVFMRYFALLVDAISEAVVA